MLLNLLAGVLTGFIVSIPPMGPISFAMISKGLNNEIKEGRSIALGAAFMDFIYCLIAFGGISLILSFFPSSATDFYTKNSQIIEIVLTFSGCAFVIFYGLKIMRSKSTFEKLEATESAKYNAASVRAVKLSEKAKTVTKSLKVPENSRSALIGLFLMGMLLCMSSLTLPASWIALIGFLKGYNFLDSTLVGGIFFSVGALAGTMAWFYLLLKFISRNKKRFNENVINKLNLYAGIILLVLGIFLFIKAIVSVFSVMKFFQ